MSINLSGKLSDRRRNHKSNSFAFAGHPTKPGVRDALILVGPAEFDGGCLVGARLTLDNFPLLISRGNYRGLWIRQTADDDYVRLDPVNPPVNVEVAGGHFDKNFALPEYESYSLAESIMSETKEELGNEGIAAWGQAVKSILADPEIDQNAWEGQQRAWAEKTGAYVDRPGEKNMVTPLIALERATEKFFTGKDFAGIAADLVAHNSIDVWMGKPAILVEEWT
jgi:hypothetical protein